VALAGIPLALMLGQAAPLAARTLAAGIDTEKSPEGTSFMSGGVGLEERQKMIKMAQGYDLKLAFADRRGEYLSDVKVTVDDGQGKQVLSTTTAGPWLYAELPQGKYDVKASFGDRTEEIKDLEISKGRLASRLIHWDRADQQIS
jgi:hypothetical protein